MEENWILCLVRLGSHPGPVLLLLPGSEPSQAVNLQHFVFTLHSKKRTASSLEVVSAQFTFKVVRVLKEMSVWDHCWWKTLAYSSGLSMSGALICTLDIDAENVFPQGGSALFHKSKAH